MKNVTLLKGMAALVALALTACPTAAPPPEPPPPAPAVRAFTASASEVAKGEAVTLSWSTEDATQVELRDVSRGVVSGVDEAALEGSVDVTLEENTLFVLTATNARGVRAHAAVSVKVHASTHDLLFAAVPERIASGEAAVLAWIAEGARTVTLSEKDGAALDLMGQTTRGSVQVTPAVTTTYVLTVDDSSRELTVEVAPTVGAFASTPAYAVPGEPLTLAWSTVGAARVTVEDPIRGELFSTSDPAQVADGTFAETVPPELAAAAILPYVLRAEGEGGAVTTATLWVQVAGNPAVTSFEVPRFAPEGGTFEVSWETEGADVVELLRDGAVIFQSTDPAEVADHTLEVPTETQDAQLELRARWSRGGAAQSGPFTVSPVGPVTFNTFAATPTLIANGGELVTLSWDVTNARHVEIWEQGGARVFSLTDPAAATGTVEVYPNKPTTYVFKADNQAGAAIPDQTTQVDVTSPARLTFSPNNVPDGTVIQLTGSTVTGGGALRAVNFNVARNAGTGQFVDISQTGELVPFSTTADTVAQVARFPHTFGTRVYGEPIAADGISVSSNGWFYFGTTPAAGPTVPSDTLPTTGLEPLSICPLLADLQAQGSSAVHWRLDGTGQQERLIVQWTSYRMYNTSGQSFTFQAQVYANGEILFAYQDLTGLSSSDDVAVGVLNGDETEAVDADTLLGAGGQPAVGDVFHFFGPLTVPAAVTAGVGRTFIVEQVVGNGTIVIEDAPAIIPPDQFAVTEVNYNPETGKEEWFEVTNLTAGALDLQGWDIDFGGSNVHTIATSLVLPPNGRVVLGQSADSAEASAGGAAVDYVYGTGFSLPDSAGSVSISLAGGAYATLAWSSPGTQGASLQLAAPRADLTLASGVTELFCPSSAPYGGGAQLGTPGGPNGSCFPYTLSAIPGAFTSILATGTPVPNMQAGDFADGTNQTLTFPVPLNIGGQAVTTLYVNANGFASVLPLSASHHYSSPTPSTSAPNGIISPYWDDLIDNSSASGVFWQQFDPNGTAGDGDEYTLVSWENWKHYSTTSSLNFQIRFLHGSGDIEFHYGTMTASSAGYANGSSAATWLEDLAGTSALIANAHSSTNPGIQSNTGFRFAFAP